MDKISSARDVFNQTFGADIHDTILAASVMKTGGKIYGLNRKHYPMPEVVIDHAW